MFSISSSILFNSLFAKIITMSKELKKDGWFEIFSQALSLKYAVFCVVDMVGLFPVIALPRAIINCGWLGIPLAFTVFLIQIYTALLLGKSWIIAEKLDKNIVKKKRCPYGALVELAYGRRLSTYVTLILDLSIFGASVPDLLIAAQNLQVIGLKMTRNETDISYCYWLLIIGVLITPIMWLGSPKDMKIIGITSVSVVFLTSILTWTSILTVDSRSVNIPQPSWEAVGIAYGTLAFQFDVHPMILSVQMDMKNKNDVGKAIIIAFMVSGGLFLVTMVLCYTLLGDSVQYNTLQSLPQSLTLDLALCLATLQVCLSMAVGSSPFFQDLEHSFGIPPVFGWKRVGLRSLLVLLSVGIGEAVPRFDLLMGLVGGALTGQLVFLFPPLLYRRLRSRLQLASTGPGGMENCQQWVHKGYYGTFGPASSGDSLSSRGWLSRTEDVVLLAVPLVGVAATGVSAFFSFRETVEFADCYLRESLALLLMVAALVFGHDGLN